MKYLSRLSALPARQNLTRAVLTVVLAAGGCVLPACGRTVGSGHLTTETRQVSGFHGVVLESDGDVIVTQGDTEGLTVEAEDNILPLITTTVDDKGVLHLGYKSNESIHTTKKTTFKLAAKTLDRLVLEGSGDIRAESLAVPGNGKFTAEVPGSGSVRVGKLTAGSVQASIEGSGDIRLGGEVDSQNVSIDGSGKYEAADLKTHTAQVDINGSGDAEVSVSESLKADINGSGDVRYHGNPKVKQSINGSGSVKALGESGR